MAMDVLRLMAANSKLLVLPRYLRWIKQNSNAPILPNDGREGLGAKIVTQMIETPRDRTQSFSASSAGSCEREQVFSYLGAPGLTPGPQLAAIFNDGKWRHLRWQSILLQAGILEDIEVPLMWKAKQQRGTMDGQGVVPDDHPVAEWRGELFGFELKGVNAYQFDSFKESGPKEEHLNQIHRYFLLSGLELFSVVYENKSTQEPYEWVIQPDEERMKQQRAEVESLYEHASNELLPSMIPECAARKGPWRWCNYGGDDGVCAFAKDWYDIETFRNRP